jgi:DNA-directed RNA polymerase subunit RPC12/RpoP
MGASKAQVIQFPGEKYILTCKHCRSHDFYIYLKAASTFEIKGYECVECGSEWEIIEKD